MAGVEDIIRSVFRFSVLQRYDKRHVHYVAYDGQYRYYIVVTTRVLQSSRRLFARDFGEMLGVRSSILAQEYDYIVWIVERGTCFEVYMERTYRVNQFCLEHRTIYRNRETGEYVCNYPVKHARKVYEKCLNRTLLDYPLSR